MSELTPERFTMQSRNVETGQWDYAPRYVVVERGRLISQDCAKCGQSIDIGKHGAKCTNCQIETANTRQSSALA